MALDFSAVPLDNRKQYSDSLKIVKKNYLEPWSINPAKLSIKYQSRNHFRKAKSQKLTSPTLFLKKKQMEVIFYRNKKKYQESERLRVWVFNKKAVNEMPVMLKRGACWQLCRKPNDQLSGVRQEHQWVWGGESSGKRHGIGRLPEMLRCLIENYGWGGQSINSSWEHTKSTLEMKVN